MTRNLLDYLHSRSRRDDNGCLIWLGAKDQHGYGMTGWEGRTWRVPRLMWTALHDHPGELCVCHKCDVPSCIEPSHLFLGTARDNARDRESKGRGNRTVRVRGEQVVTAKLTWPEVRTIRARHAAGERVLHLAREYGLHHSTVDDVVRGRSWRENPEIPASTTLSS